MKKYFLPIALILLLAGSASYAWMGAGQMAGSVPAAGASYACDVSTADICEDWEPETLTWTDVTTGGTITDNASHSGTLSCTDKGSAALQIEYTSQADLYTRIDLGSQQNVVYGSIYFIIVDRPNAVNGTAQAILCGGNTTDGTIAGIRVITREYASEQLQVQVTYNNGTVFAAGYQNISEDTWYMVSFLYSSDGVADDADDTVTWWLDGTQIDTVTNANLTLTQRPRYFTVSNSAEVAGSVGVVFQVDNLELDYTEMPAACP